MASVLPIARESNSPFDSIISLLADALADRISQKLADRREHPSFRLVDREGACRLLSCSTDYFRERIEPNVACIPMPSSGDKREFRRWDVEDLKQFVLGLKREPGHPKPAS
jgi:hypothetical protein